MIRSRKVRIITEYPDWHHQPLRLTSGEMGHPWVVLDQFFQMYHLPQVRTRLKEWLDDALRAEDNDASSHVNTYDMVERLIEAAFILYTDNEFCEGQQCRPIGSSLTASLTNAETGITQTLRKGRPEKEGLLVNSKQNVPETYIKEVFRLVAPENLKAGLRSWIKVKVSQDLSRCIESRMKCNPIEFGDDLFRLIEALHLKSEIRDLLDTTGKEELSFGLKENLRKDRSFAHLLPAQINNPRIVLASFFAKFSLEYCRIELWSLLDAAINFKDQFSDDDHKANLLLYYECYISVVEISWLLNEQKQNEPNDTIDEETAEE